MTDFETTDGRNARRTASREKLIAAGFNLLSDKGVKGITMRALAESAGMALATAYNVFGSKAELLAAMLDSIADIDREGETTKALGDPIDNLIKMTDQITLDWTKPDSQLVTLLRATVRHGGVASYLSPGVHSRTTNFCAWLAQIGVIHNDLPASHIAWRIVYANAGLFDAWLDGRISADELRRQHRLNVLIPLLALSKNAYRDAIQTKIEQTAFD